MWISSVHNGWEITQWWINTKIQFSCSYNLETYHRIYLWVISVSFLHFQSLLRFMKNQFGYEEPMVIIVDEIVFSQNQILNKKWNSYINFFLVLCFTPFVVDVTVITLLLSQIYVCANSYRLFNVLDRKWWHQHNGQHIFKIFVYKFYKTYIQSYFVPSLL